MQGSALLTLAAMLQTVRLDVAPSVTECTAQAGKCSQYEREAIIASGALPALAALSSSDHPQMQELATAAMVHTVLPSSCRSFACFSFTFNDDANASV